MMRLPLILTGLILGLGAPTSVNAEEINILFLGNSFTFRHDLPKLVKQVFEEGQPDLTVNVERVVYGGQCLFRHYNFYGSETMVRLNSITVEEVEAKSEAIKANLALKKAPDFFNNYWKQTNRKTYSWKTVRKNMNTALTRQAEVIERINNNERVKWDYLVLQSWGGVVPDLEVGYGEYAQKWAKIAEQEGIKTILYITAPHAQNKKPVTEPQALEKTEMEMKSIQKLVEIIKPHAVVPVALGMKNLQQNGTDIKLRYRADAHPNQYGAFLTSNMFYAAFFKKSTEGFDYNTVTETKLNKGGKDPNGGSAKVVFDDETKTLLQKTAFDAVMEFDAGYGK